MERNTYFVYVTIFVTGNGNLVKCCVSLFVPFFRQGHKADHSPLSSAEVKNGGVVPPLPKNLLIVVFKYLRKRAKFFVCFVTCLIVYWLQTSFYNTVVKTSDYAVLLSKFLTFWLCSLSRISLRILDDVRSPETRQFQARPITLMTLKIL
jgi:hypothetical protein